MPDTPVVTFVVPCYRLARYLAECVESILRQSFRDIEILILDDQSPDETPEVAERLVADHPGRDVIYLRNEVNLGNIRTYNKGIGLARGRYVWILSPDDRLRSADVVARYVDRMEADGDIGFCFCAAHTIEDERDVGVNPGSAYRPFDLILDRQELVRDIVHNNFELVAASVLIRRACYEKVALFPTDIPHRGDSYVWALIAAVNKVAYFSAPMVDYRVHAASMMSTLARERIAQIGEDDVAVPWRVKTRAEALGLGRVVEDCWDAIVSAYWALAMGIQVRGHAYSLPVEGFESSLQRWAPDGASRARVRTRLAARLYWTGLAELTRGNVGRGRGALRYAVRLDSRLRYRPPLGQLARTPHLARRVLAVLGTGARRLLLGRRPEDS
jgi:glycosyltransferase involved in cell wall biosynthesis